MIGALTEDLGLSAWYQPLNDISSTQGKIAGAAQKRVAGRTVLHHATMAYDMDAAMMRRVLRARGSGARPSASTRCADRPGWRAQRSWTR